MCIIVSKAGGVPLPSKDILERCFDRNDDGAGFMYAKDGRVFIQKGYMEFNKFYKAILKKVDEGTPAVLHCRVATHGSISKENCHPFPITNRKNLLRSLSVETDIGLAHNGIISIKTEGDLSDTGQFIKDILADDGIRPYLKRPAVLQLIAKSINGGRFSFLFGDGEIINLGLTWEEKDGIFYSNSDYKEYASSTWGGCTTIKYINGHRFESFEKFTGKSKGTGKLNDIPHTSTSEKIFEIKEGKVCPECFGEVGRKHLLGLWYCLKCDKYYGNDELVDLFLDDDETCEVCGGQLKMVGKELLYCPICDEYYSYGNSSSAKDVKVCNKCNMELAAYDEDEDYGYCTYCGAWVDFEDDVQKEEKLIGV